MIATIARTTLLLFALILCACGGHDEDAPSGASTVQSDALPAPVSGAGVTGTADIAPGGQGQTPSLGGAPPATPPAGDLVIQELPPIANPETGVGIDPDGDGPLTAPPAVDAGAAEPTSADAVSVVRDYYTAINARDYGRAHALWSGNGSASGQSPQQFAAGFAQTQSVSVEVGAPGREDAGAGQRYLEVPVSVRATQADGSVRRYAGSYVLQRTVVDGATAEQRSWRIRSADLREVQQ
jgi:hypothetical protein